MLSQGDAAVGEQAGSLNYYSRVLRAGRRKEEGVIAQGWLVSSHRLH